jgi:hypothetical protein
MLTILSTFIIYKLHVDLVGMLLLNETGRDSWNM